MTFEQITSALHTLLKVAHWVTLGSWQIISVMAVLENHCKDRKWCFLQGVALWVLLGSPHMAHRLLCFLVVSLLWCPIGLFSLFWCLLCSLPLGYSTALMAVLASHFPRCLQVGLMLKTNNLKWRSRFVFIWTEGWPKVNHWAVFARASCQRKYLNMSQRWNFLPRYTAV